MANTFMPKINKSQKVKKRLVASVWLLMALAMGGVVFLLWTVTLTTKPATETPIKANASVEAETFSIGLVQEIDNLHELDEAVEPVSFDALVKDLRDYPPEFKDAKYFKKYKDKWTVQVMDVSERDIITDYLDGRKDRNKFAYFRYRDENNQPRYILTYGIMPTPQMAMGATKTVKFGLPANVRVLPEEISHYVTIIENYELSLPVRDLATNRARKVRLQPTEKEIAAKRLASEDSALANGRGDNKKDSGNAATSQTSNSSSSTIQEEVIKGSVDTSDTISVQENRQVITPKNEANQQAPSSNTPNATSKPATGTTNSDASSNNSSNTGTQSSASRPQPESPAQPSVATPTLPAANKTNNTQQDSMRQLIEERTQ